MTTETVERERERHVATARQGKRRAIDRLADLARKCGYLPLPDGVGAWRVERANE